MSDAAEKRYAMNEFFYSLQGEGARKGTANVFARFAGCNMACRREPGPRSPGGFDCDTEFAGAMRMTAAEVVAAVQRVDAGKCGWVILTGGEPALQADAPLLAALKAAGYQIAVETNGSLALCEGFDWVSLSPKTAEHALRQLTADELRYVRADLQALPNPAVAAKYHFLSPAADADGFLPADNVRWCLRLCLENPRWRLSTQDHKAWAAR